MAENQCSQVAMWVLITSHRWQQHIERVGIIMSYPADEKGLGAAYSAMPPAFDVLAHPRRKNMILQHAWHADATAPRENGERQSTGWDPVAVGFL